MNLLSIKSSKLNKSKENNAVYQDSLATITQPLSNDFFLPHLSKIKSEWYYQKFPILLTDSNEFVLVKLAIKQIKKDLKRIINKINTIEISNESVVPKRKYELLTKKYDELAIELIQLKKDFFDSHESFIQIQAEQLDLIVQRDRLIVETERLKSKLTPRPVWSKCTKYISCGPKLWQNYTKKYSSNELVDILLNEFVGGNDGTNTEHLINCENDTNCENMKLCKRDVLLIIHEILTERFQNLPSRESLDSCIRNYFCRKFYYKNEAIKWYCNLIDSLNRFEYIENVFFFKSYLNGKIDESIYHHFRKISNELQSLWHSMNTNEVINNEFDKLSVDDYYNNNSERNSTHASQITPNASMNSFLTKNDKLTFNSKLNFSKSNLRVPEQVITKLIKNKFQDIMTTDLRSLINAAKIDFLNKPKRIRLKSKPMQDDYQDQDMLDLSILFQIEDDGSLSEFLTKLKFYVNKERNNYTLRFLNEVITRKNLILTDNWIKTDNSDNKIILEVGYENKIQIEERITNNPPKIKKTKKKRKVKDKLKKFKKKITSKLFKRKKRKISSKNNLFKKPLEKVLIDKSKPEDKLKKSSSIDSITSYSIDINDQKVYDQLITSDEFRLAILEIDSEISILEMQRYIDWIFKSKEDSIKTSEIKLGRVIRRLQNINCFMH